MLYINVESLRQAVADIQSLGGKIVCSKTAVPKTAWVAIVADPQGNPFGVWRADARLDQVPVGSGTTATVGGREGTALFNVEGTIYAIDDSCLHQGASLGTRLSCRSCWVQ